MLTSQTLTQRSFTFSTPNFQNSKQPPPEILLHLYYLCNTYLLIYYVTFKLNNATGLINCCRFHPTRFWSTSPPRCTSLPLSTPDNFFNFFSPRYRMCVPYYFLCVRLFSLGLPDKKFEEQWTANRKSKPLSRIRHCAYALIIFIIIALFSINLNVNRISTN